MWGYSSVWLERWPVKPEAAGSSPVTPARISLHLAIVMYARVRGTALQGPLTQLVESRTFNPLVIGSSPIRPTTTNVACLWNCPLSLAAKDSALSRRHQGFEFPRGHHFLLPHICSHLSLNLWVGSVLVSHLGHI